MFKKRKILTELIIKVIVIVVLLLLLLLVIKIQSRQNISENPYLSADIQVKTYKIGNGWGYDIYDDGRLLIHQPNIPALSGNHGFTLEADAQKVAKLVIGKIKGNIMPPTLTLEDLKKIGIGK